MFVSRVQSSAGNYVRPLAKKTANKLIAGNQFSEIKFNDTFSKKVIADPEDMKVVRKKSISCATGEPDDVPGGVWAGMGMGLCLDY